MRNICLLPYIYIDSHGFLLTAFSCETSVLTKVTCLLTLLFFTLHF